MWKLALGLLTVLSGCYFPLMTCDTHDDCGPGAVCIRSGNEGDGMCAFTCETDTAPWCPPPTVCQACATNSGATRFDCVSACIIPPQPDIVSDASPTLP